MTAVPAQRLRLAQSLAELEARAGRIEAALAEPLSADSEEQAVEREDDDALAGEEHLVAREIAAVRAALERWDAGTYGACLSCGEPIAEARLAAVPEATLCIACARRAEAG